MLNIVRACSLADEGMNFAIFIILLSYLGDVFFRKSKLTLYRIIQCIKIGVIFAPPESRI